MSEKRKLITRCYYTDYVNHMIRFYMSCPDSVQTNGKRRSDIENWIAVQGVLHGLTEENRDKVLTIYRMHHNLPKAVDMYCQATGADYYRTWQLLTRVSALIARRRGLV